MDLREVVAEKQREFANMGKTAVQMSLQMEHAGRYDLIIFADGDEIDRHQFEVFATGARSQSPAVGGDSHSRPAPGLATAAHRGDPRTLCAVCGRLGGVRERQGRVLPIR